MKNNPLKTFAKLWPMMKDEKRDIIIAFFAVIATSALSLIGPLGIGYTIDHYIIPRDFSGVLVASGILLVIFLLSFAVNYVQMLVMGAVAQRILWKLRNDLFKKLQELSLSFFNQYKSGDLISRINSDTEKVNQFLSEGLMRFAANIFMVIGAGIFILFIQPSLALTSFAPGVVILIFTALVSKAVGKANKEQLRVGGLLSGEVQESIANFKVILAFNRRDYFRTHFKDINSLHYKASVRAGVWNEVFTPFFEWMGNIAQIIVLAYGIYLVAGGQLALGLLVSFFIYVTRFYDPLREMARLWSSLATALAAWDRIGSILHLVPEIQRIPLEKTDGKGLLEFRNVSFSYPNGIEVLKDINFVFEKGKTYALVGPTGGGKTTTASLIARLYDPARGTVYLDGKDIRSYEADERVRKIGFILQEPMLFAGTIRDNLLYGNSKYGNLSEEEVHALLKRLSLSSLIEKFPEGLSTKVESSTLPLGQKQMIAFMRAVLREPDLLILDEATANIDTVTEKILEDILNKLPPTTTRVIIAHRLNTIANADDIFFVNGTHVTEAGSMEHAVEMLLHGKRKS
ncbi:MAG: ABC transporter ATP-binding protein [Patescibacteria group bacterium]